MSYRNMQARSIDDYEIVNQCGSGTYGSVFKAIHKQTRTIVALKKVSQFPVEDGDPVEIKYLSQLYTSKNIIRLKDHFFTREGELALVFEYMETDLWRLISGPSANLPLFQVKCIMKQLFEGLHQCHSAGIMHRDIKPSNLLISSSGVLKLADFGLTTSYISPAHLSNNVVSLYYRPPELLMGSRSYGPEIDVWSAGCILVELLTNNYLFAGANDVEQLDLIFRIFGTPTEEVWPGVSQLPGWGLVDSAEQHPLRQLRETHCHLDHNVLDLATRLLRLDPKERITSYEALQHPWFWTTPLPSHSKHLPLLWKSRVDAPKREWRKANGSNSSASSIGSIGSGIGSIGSAIGSIGSGIGSIGSGIGSSKGTNAGFANNTNKSNNNTVRSNNTSTSASTSTSMPRSNSSKNNTPTFNNNASNSNANTNTNNTGNNNVNTGNTSGTLRSGSGIKSNTTPNEGKNNLSSSLSSVSASNNTSGNSNNVKGAHDKGVRVWTRERSAPYKLSSSSSNNNSQL